MFDEIGKKIKKLVIFQTVIGIVFLIVLSLALLIEFGFSAFWGVVAILLIGSLLLWISSFWTYAYGELVQSSMDSKTELNEIKNILRNTKANQKKNAGAYELIEYDKEILYGFAMDIIQNKNYKFAYNALIKIRDYKDSEKLLDTIAKELLETTIKSE